MRIWNGLSSVAVALFVFATSIAALAQENIFSEIVFVSSKYELAVAVSQVDTLKGLAVSVTFYNDPSADYRTVVDLLVANVISKKFRPVFLYGQPFDRELARRYFVTEDGSTCYHTVYAGIVPTTEDLPIEMCAADSNPRDETSVRSLISSHWVSTKKYLVEHYGK